MRAHLFNLISNKYAIFIAIFWLSTCFIYKYFYGGFSLGSRFLYLHAAIQGAFIYVPFALAIITRRIYLSFFLWFICGLVHVIIPLSYVIESVATDKIGQRISIEFIFNNWPIIAGFVKIWILIGLIILVLIVAVALTYSLYKLSMPLNKKSLLVRPALLLAGISALALVHIDVVSRKIQWEPVLALYGYQSDNFYFGTDIDLLEKEKLAVELYKPSGSISKRNIIIFMADSINPYYLKQFGYHRDTIPFLETLKTEFSHVRQSVARSTCAESICGVMSTLTSRNFSALTNYDALSISYALRKNGYKVNFILASDHKNYLNGHYGKFIEAQADFIHDFTKSEHPVDSDRIILEGLDALPDQPNNPTLTFVFFFSSHVFGETEKEFEIYGRFLELSEMELEGETAFTKDEKARLSIHYSNKLRQLSDYMHRSFDILKKKGYLRNADFIFLADHGEEIGERSILVHGPLTEGGLRIPLVWASNSRVPPIDEVLPTQLDIAPTLAEIAGIEIPEIWQGESLFSKQDSKLIFHENGNHKFLRNNDCKAVYGELLGFREAKYIRCNNPNQNITQAFYDISKDFFERNNIWNKQTEATKIELKNILEKQFD